MKRKEKEKEGVLLQDSCSSLTHDEVDTSAPPRQHHNAVVSRSYSVAWRANTRDSESISLLGRHSQRRVSLRISQKRPSVRGPRLVVSRRSFCPNSVHRPARLSRSFSTRLPSSTVQLISQSEVKGWPLSPWTVYLSRSGVLEDPKAAEHLESASCRDVYVAKEASQRHGGSVARAPSRRRNTVAINAESRKQYEVDVLEETLAGEESPGHPRLVRYIGQPSRISPARNQSWRKDQLKDPAKEEPGLKDQKTDSQNLGRTLSVAGRLRASLRWRKPKAGGELPGLRRAAVRRSATTTVSDHMKTTLTILPTVASFHSLSAPSSPALPSPPKDTRGSQETLFHVHKEPKDTVEDSTPQHDHHHHHHSR